MDQGFSFSTLVSGVVGGGGGGWWGTADITSEVGHRDRMASSDSLPLVFPLQLLRHSDPSILEWARGKERMQPPSHFASPLRECVIKHRLLILATQNPILQQ